MAMIVLVWPIFVLAGKQQQVHSLGAIKVLYLSRMLSPFKTPPHFIKKFL
ncbi:hypothetical protein JGUZn3_12700 [Entomobacter blattae]|uniref:Uncharacterized protein n=1 Tax=Entomobacter blattae TaxID=2762277 RepID=A0A7H1NRT6_9PROT|nr:hypothetical protein JGUZn3_12700 [Entomobacter blattae]